MLSTLSETLPFAIGVAASAAAVIALVLILQGSRALPSGLSFTLGWVLGVGVVCAVGVAFGLELIDRSRLAERTGKLPRPLCDAIDDGLRAVLGL